MNEPDRENRFTVTRVRDKGRTVALRVSPVGRDSIPQLLQLTHKTYITRLEGLRVNLSAAAQQVHSTRPLYYVFGYLRAMTGERAPLSGDCVDEIRCGFAYGLDVAEGRQPRPAWHMT